MTEDELAKEVLLTMQRALLGEVSAHLRMVSVRWSDTEIHFDSYFDGEITEDDEETMSVVETEVLAGFSQTHTMTYVLHRVDLPAPLPKKDRTVFARQERLWPTDS